MFAVITAKGPAWDNERGIREQAAFDQHAHFMDRLVERGIVVLGGPIESDDKDVVALVVVEAQTVREAEGYFAGDPWIANGVFRLESVRAWTIWLDGRERP
jgi:uncharacterized protein YciI